MKLIRVMTALFVGLGLSACAMSDTATRNTPPGNELIAAPSVPALKINRVIVDVPQSLEVSEANRYFPAGDIVWREDPLGDRHAQVKAIVEDAMTKGVAGLDGPTTVDLHIQITRFHALTQKARYTTGGVHDVEFNMTLLHPKTGEPLAPSRFVEAGFKAYGGEAAVAAEARGETQKVRITEHLAQVVRTELTDPEGFKAVRLGLLEMFN
ncbi:DUF6778 family protein [Roseovarius sp. CH_XMU1461]|uniref:DUF6778 family protein n=1 Tax=Roseovarius sp. CH_XMU1461 TaxID=3107777 RepID=UPI00300AE517